MSAELLSSILWVPFALIAFITGLIYCISGYKKGLWRALISLVSVVVSTALSVLTSRLLAKILVPNVSGLLSGQLGGMGLSMAVAVVEGAAVVVLAMAIFGLMMLVITPILSAIAQHYLGKRLQVQNKFLKWMGMLVGVVSALAFTLFWLSPLYGTLATVVPVAQSMMQIRQTGNTATEADVYMEALGDHLLVQVSGEGPVRIVYDGLSKAPLGESSVSMVEVADAVNEAIALIAQLENVEDPEVAGQLLNQLVDLTQEKFLNQDWFYELYCQITDQVRDMAADSTMEDIEYIRSLLDLADMPKAEFQEVCNTALDFARFVLKNVPLAELEDPDPAMIYESGILQELGKTMNSSDRMVKIKKLAIALMLEEAGLSFQEANQLMEKYQLGQLTDPADQLLEVEALLLPGLSREIPPVILVLRHPSLGEAALKDMEQYVTFQEMMGLDESVKITAKQQTQMLKVLKQAAKLSFEEIAQLQTGLGNLMSAANASVDYAN